MVCAGRITQPLQPDQLRRFAATLAAEWRPVRRNDSAMTARKLQEIAGRACFVPLGTFHRSLDLSWLKPYVILTDHVVLESRATLEYYPNSLTYREPAILRWLERRMVFLDVEGGLPSRRHLAEEMKQRVASVALKADGTFNRTFLKTFFRRMELREEGASDFSDRYGLRDKGARFGEADAHTVRVLIDELVDAYYASFALSSAAIQPVVDPLEDWLLRRVLRRECGPTYLHSFRAACLTAIPDFTLLPWEAVVALTESKWRKPCIERFRMMGAPPDQQVRRDVVDALWQLATDVGSQMSLPKTIFRGVLGNLPGLPINPFGLGLAAQEARSVRRQSRDHGWLFFLQEIRQRAGSAQQQHATDGATRRR